MSIKTLVRSTFSHIYGVSTLLAPFYRGSARLTGRYRIPVLVYHKVTADTAAAGQLTYAVSEATFARQMGWLAEAGYRPLTLDAYLERLAGRQAFPPNSLLITFDDGYAAVATRAYPALRRHGFPAVVFLVSGAIGGADVFRGDEKYAHLPADVRANLPPLSWEQVRGMSDLVALGGHTVRHVRVGRLSPEEGRRELAECRQQIAAETGRPVRAFAYPHGIRRHGDYNDQTRAWVQEAGYEAAFVSEIGRNRATDDPYRQRRIEPKEADSRRLFLSKLVGGYDWVGLAQGAFHSVFRPDEGY